MQSRGRVGTRVIFSATNLVSKELNKQFDSALVIEILHCS